MGSAVRVPPASPRSAILRAAAIPVALAAAPAQATGDPAWSIVSGVVVVLVIGAVVFVLRRRHSD